MSRLTQTWWWTKYVAPTETKPRPAQEIALDARRAERRAEDEARAAKRLHPKKEQR